jgi:hypothetical protein
VSNERKVVLLLIGGFLVVSLMSWFPGPDATDIVRFLVNCTLCWFLWKGANWARWVAGVLAILACGLGAIVLLRTPMQMEAMVPLVAMTLFYGFAAHVLLSLQWVRSHFMAGGVR